MKKVLRIVSNTICYILIAACLLLSIFVFYCKTVNKPIFVFGKTIFWVATQSMETEIPARSYVLVDSITAADVKIGDVITFLSDDPSIKGYFNTHRVLDIIGDNEEFITKGDNNLIQDGYTAKAANIVGRYNRKLPILSSIGRFMLTPIGLIMTFTMMFLLILFIFMPMVKKANKEYDEEIKEEKQKRFDQLVQAEVERLRKENENNNISSEQKNTDEETK